MITWVAKVRRLPPPVLIAIGMVSVVVITAVAAPAIAPYDPNAQDLSKSVQPPVWSTGGDWDHILGTDRLGRDMFSRLVFGARIAVFLSASAVIIGLVVGGTLGLIAGYRGGSLDSVIMRAADFCLALPLILLALALAVSVGGGVTMTFGLMVFALWGSFARQARAEAIAVRDRDFIASSQISGLSSTRIMLRHLIPASLNALVVTATLQLGGMILLEAGLSFVGVGIPAEIPAWGTMISDGLNQLLFGAWWISVLPALAIGVTVLAVNVAGDALRDALDPQLRNQA